MPQDTQRSRARLCRPLPNPLPNQVSSAHYKQRHLTAHHSLPSLHSFLSTSLRYVPFEERYPPEWVHDPNAAVPRMELAHVPLKETWSAMEGLLKANLTRNIGVANMTTSGLRDLISYATVPPAVLQVELHPYLQQAKLLRYAEEQGIVVTGFSPLGSASYVELSMATTSDSCLDTEIVRYLAVKHKKSPAQIVLKWAVQRGTSVIPKSSKAERVRENADLFDGTWGLSDEDMEAMGMLDKNKRFNDPGGECSKHAAAHSAGT